MFKKTILFFILLFALSVNAEVSTVSSSSDFTGLSTDTKPTNLVGAGSKFYETDTLSVYEYDSVAWLPVKWKGAINVHDADVHVNAVNKSLHQHTAVTTTISTASDVDDYELIVVNTNGFVIGDSLHINTGNEELTHPVITNITGAIGGTLTLDRRLDRAHDVGGTVTVSVVDLASQVGTLAAPQIYWAGPSAGEIWHITNLTLAMGHGTAGDFGLFGNIAALTNGVILRVKVSGNYGTLTNWKTNGEINVDTGEVAFHTRSSGGGTHGTAANGAFRDRTGAIMRLDGDLGDRFEIYVQDDLTTMSFWNMKVQGHIEGQ